MFIFDVVRLNLHAEVTFNVNKCVVQIAIANYFICFSMFHDLWLCVMSQITFNVPFGWRVHEVNLNSATV